MHEFPIQGFQPWTRTDIGNIAMTAVGMEPLLYQCLALKGAEDEGTVIVDPRGTVLAKTSNHHEDTASTRIPIADFRKTRRMPEVPETYKEAGALVRRRMQGG